MVHQFSSKLLRFLPEIISINPATVCNRSVANQICFICFYYGGRMFGVPKKRGLALCAVLHK